MVKVIKRSLVVLVSGTVEVVCFVGLILAVLILGIVNVVKNGFVELIIVTLVSEVVKNVCATELVLVRLFFVVLVSKFIFIGSLLSVVISGTIEVVCVIKGVSIVSMIVAFLFASAKIVQFVVDVDKVFAKLV